MRSCRATMFSWSERPAVTCVRSANQDAWVAAPVPSASHAKQVANLMENLPTRSRQADAATSMINQTRPGTKTLPTTGDLATSRLRAAQGTNTATRAKPVAQDHSPGTDGEPFEASA